MSLKSLTTDADLEIWAKKLRIPVNFIGFKDEIKKSNPRPGAYIINLESSTNGSGTHWTGLYLAPNKHAFYFDSFGAPALDEALALMKDWTNNMKNIHINPYDIQSIDSGFCGQYVIDFLAHIMRNPTIEGFRHFLHKYKLFRVQKNKDVNI